MPKADLSTHTHSTPRVGLFVTCLVDLFRPQIGFASVKLLEQAGCEVQVPTTQTCCGQPAYNSGDIPDTRAIAEQTIAAFTDVDYVVAPSGSCVGQIKKIPEFICTQYSGACAGSGSGNSYLGDHEFLGGCVATTRAEQLIQWHGNLP